MAAEDPALCDLPGAPDATSARAASSPLAPTLDLDSLSPEDVLEAYAARGWGDGLPLVPPTAARGRCDARFRNGRGRSR